VFGLERSHRLYVAIVVEPHRLTGVIGSLQQSAQLVLELACKGLRFEVSPWTPD
jgi:hypothetical protein